MAIYSSDGKIIVDSGGNIVKCDQCPCEQPSAPCECPAGLADCYMIDGYYDGYFDVTQCNPLIACSGDSWDGKFKRSGDLCQWDLLTDPSGVCVSGYAIETPQTGINLVTLASPNCYWEMSVWLVDVDTNYMIWSGKKYIGLTPAGEYRQISGAGGGCDIDHVYIFVKECP